MIAWITSPTSMVALPMPKSIVIEVLLADDRRNDRHDHPVDEGVDDRLEVERHHEADGDGDHVALVDEVPVLTEQLLHGSHESSLSGVSSRD